MWRPGRTPRPGGAGRRCARGPCARRSIVRVLGGDRALQRGAEGVDVGGALVADAVQRGGVGEVQPVRRRDVLHEVLALAARPGGSGRCRRRRCRSARSRASAPAATRPAARRRRARARRRRSAARSARRPAAATPNAVETVPSIPFAPRLESTRNGVSRAGKNVSTSRIGIEEATTSVASGGSSVPSSAATRGSLSPAGPTTSAIARDAARSASCQPSSQEVSLRLRGSLPASVSSVARGSAPTIVATTPEGSCQACSASNATCSASRPASHVRSGLEVGRSPTRSTRSGRVRRGPLRVAQQRVVVRDRGGAAARAGGRLGQQRRARALGERGQRRGQARVALGPPGDDDRLRPHPQLVLEALEQPVGGDAAGQRPRHPRPAALAAGHDLDVRDPVAVREQRLAQREVEVHRPGPAVDRGVERAAGELAQPADAGGAGRVVVDLEVPLGGAAVELDLVDRLPGADVAQLRRAVGGQHEQRHARLVGLDHGGRVVGGGGAGGAGDRGGDAGRLGQAEREEGGAALVQVGGGAQAAVRGRA